MISLISSITSRRELQTSLIEIHERVIKQDWEVDVRNQQVQDGKPESQIE